MEEEVKSVELKDETIQVGHKVYHRDEITVDIYKQIVSVSPNFEKSFNVKYKKTKANFINNGENNTTSPTE